MTDHPYTDDDLIAEAARQHRILTEDPDFGGVGEGMEDRRIVATETPAPDALLWDDLSEEQYHAAQLKIHNLINNAADTSRWAVALGADGLEPWDAAISVGDDEPPMARLLFAFAPDVPTTVREQIALEAMSRLARIKPRW